MKLKPNIVGLRPNGIAEIIGIQIVEQRRDGESGITAKILAPQASQAVALNDRVKDDLPVN